MATLTIQDVPEASYAVISRRARANGQSIEEYVRQLFIDVAASPTKAESVELIEQVVGRTDAVTPSTDQILVDIAAERR